MGKKLQLVVTLPEQLAELPVKILRGSAYRELVFSIQSPDEELLYEDRLMKYTFVWLRDSYIKVALEDIQWIEADKSYSIIHIAGKRSMTVSFNLAVVKKDLPKNEFIQIHRSYVINLRHVESMTGNCLKIADRLFVIGREYRNTFLEHFIFLGIRRRKK